MITSGLEDRHDQDKGAHMDAGRRSTLAAGLYGLAAAGTASTALAAGKPTTDRLQLSSNALQQIAHASLVRNVVNRYCVYESLGRIPDMLNSFALSLPDVQIDVGFGLYYGPDSARKFAAVTGILLGDSSTGVRRKGALNVFANTTDIIEVAEDLKTAKGLWITNAAMTNGSPSEGFNSRYGYFRRAIDLVNLDGTWKIWHYITYWLIDAPFGKSWIDPDVVEANSKTRYDWIPDNLKPDQPSSVGIGPMWSWRPDRPVTQVRVPVPYRTFADTFSYGAFRDSPAAE
jgi:hypothetical protein